MRVRGDDPSRLEVSDHDLWVVDERLTFAKYFASDVAVYQLIADAKKAVEGQPVSQRGRATRAAGLPKDLPKEARAAITAAKKARRGRAT